MVTMTTVAIAGSHPALVPYLTTPSLTGYTTPTLPSPQSTTPQAYPAGSAHAAYLYQKRDGQLAGFMMMSL